MLKIGSIIDGKYKILNKIGQGGMSVVYLAMNEKANKQWAVKEVRKDGVKDYDVVRQGLIAETDILKKLNHPNLPSIIDVIDRDDTFLIVMDYIEGKNLDYWLKTEGAQPQERVVDWAIQICDVLGYLHSRKPPIIYRDLKPANIMLRPDGQIEIIDFGTAREFKETSVEDTSCLGTQGYAAPEQYGGHGQTDARTDIYTLGATMYHLLTGHNPSLPPYEMYPIRQWNESLSTGLERIVTKCTQRNPDDRYQNCAEVMYALQHYTELDNSYRKKQKRRMSAFVGTCAATVLCVGACIGFNVAANSTQEKVRGGLVEDAEALAATQDYDGAIEQLGDAIETDATNIEAYNLILSYCINDTDTPNSINSDEYLILKKYMDPDSDYMVQLKRADNDAYYDLCYDVASSMVAYFNSSSENYFNYSRLWLAEVQEADEGDVDSWKQTMATAFYSLLQNAQTIKNGGSVSTSSDDETESLDMTGQNLTSEDASYSNYSEYWTAIQSVTGDLTDVPAGPRVLLYRFVVSEITTYANNFRSDGVEQDSLEAMLDAALSDCADADGTEEYTNLSELAESARKQISSVYSYRTTDTSDASGADAAEGGE